MACASAMKGKTMSDMISRQAAIDALWKALYEYEDKTEKQFQESEDLDAAEWFQHRIFVQNMSDIDRRTLLDLPTIDAVPVVHGKWVVRHFVTEGNGVDIPFCTACEKPNRFPQKTAFCPNCGAIMDGEMEDDG